MLPTPTLVQTIPYRPSRIRRLVVRMCFLVTFIAVVIYTAWRMTNLIERTKDRHANPNRTTHRSTHPQGSPAR